MRCSGQARRARHAHPTAREAHERLNKLRALAVFSSDALSSVAYGGEEIMKVLILARRSAPER